MNHYTRGLLVAGTLCFCLLVTTTWHSFRNSRRPASASSLWRPQHQPADRDEAAELAKQIWDGSLAYLIMGETYPAKKWVRRSRWPLTSVLYVSWKKNVSRLLLRRRVTGPKFRYFYLPRSTWAAARNRHLGLMKDVEVDQGWRFEFIIYVDEDVTLGVRNLGHFKTIVLKENDDFAFRRLHKLLMRDTPLVAGVSLWEPVEDDRDNATCVQRCHFDNMLVAMHRTAVDILPPYDTRLDNVTWWASAYMRNVYMAAVIPQFCNYYRDIAVDSRAQKHGDYPRTGLSLHLHAKELAAEQLRRLGSIRGIPNDGSACCWVSRLIDEQEDSFLHPPCVVHPRGTDFETLAIKSAQSFRRITEWQSEQYMGLNSSLMCCLPMTGVEMLPSSQY